MVDRYHCFSHFIHHCNNLRPHIIFKRFQFVIHPYRKVGQDRIVGIVTHYGMDGSGIDSQWGRDFPHSSRPALGPTQPPM
jgi:hypothetical protein